VLIAGNSREQAAEQCWSSRPPSSVGAACRRAFVGLAGQDRLLLGDAVKGTEVPGSRTSTTKLVVTIRGRLAGLYPHAVPRRPGYTPLPPAELRTRETER
jgi:hypothetical protein